MITILRQHSFTVNEHYLSRYVKFINGCRKIKFDTGYTENHHIIPKSFGGDKNCNNMIRMSARHHLLAHVLLAKATNNPKMIKALHRMVHSRRGSVNRKYKISSRVYAYLREEHAKVVSAYSKNTVVAKHLSGEVKRIPKKLFDYYNGILYTAVSKGRIDSPETKFKKSQASKKPRNVKQDTPIRRDAASLYSYVTPKGFCLTSQKLKERYPSFNKNTLTLIKDEYIITHKFASIHPEFNNSIGMSLAEFGITRIKKEKQYE